MSYQAPNIPAVKHCFFDRRGGVSSGIYANLNTNPNSRDDPANLHINLCMIAKRFNCDYNNLMLINQGTSNYAVYVNHASQFDLIADGLVTDTKGIILGIRTADCCPVLFYDEANRVIGAAHAGWRGALYGILENTLNLMIERGAQLQTINAALGPCLQMHSFECRQDMYDEFTAQNPEYSAFFIPGRDVNHYQFDLEAFVIRRLQTCGLTNITASGIDTYTDGNYFSFRRNTHRNLIQAPKDYPTHLSTITL